jgi:membrane protease YdiL (CAAX protease family)
MGHRPEDMPALTNTPRGLLVVCGTELLVFGAVFLFAWLASRANRDDLLLRWRGGFWTVPLGIGYSVALRIALAMGLLGVILVLVLTKAVNLNEVQHFALANRPDVEAIVDVKAMRQNPLYYWLTLTLVSFVLAGLREELWRSGMLAGFKALFPRTFGSRGGQFLAAAIIAVVFGLGHFPQGPLAMCLVGFLGLGLGGIMILHRSIWPAVIAHGMFDATSLALLPWVLEKLPALK